MAALTEVMSEEARHGYPAPAAQLFGREIIAFHAFLLPFHAFYDTIRLLHGDVGIVTFR
jgi:hypothetical protein